MARSMEVIDQIVEEHLETRDCILGDWNECCQVHHEEMKVEDGLRLETTKLKTMLYITLVVIIVLVAISVTKWIGQFNVQLKDLEYVNCNQVGLSNFAFPFPWYPSEGFSFLLLLGGK